MVAPQGELLLLFDTEDGDEGELGLDSADERHWIRQHEDTDARYFVETVGWEGTFGSVLTTDLATTLVRPQEPDYSALLSSASMLLKEAVEHMRTHKTGSCGQ